VNSPSSLAPVAESLEHTICSGTRLSDMSNGTAIASASLPPGWPTAYSRSPQSLETCVSSCGPVRPQSIEELRTWLAQAFPVSHSAKQENDEERATPEICGPRPSMPFAQFDQAESYLKTCQGSFFADTPALSYSDFPDWGMWDGTELFELPKPELFTIEPDGGWLPTPRVARSYTNPSATNTRPNECLTTVLLGGKIDHSQRPHPAFVEWLMGFPIGWTRLAPVEMHRFHEWLERHGSF